MKAGITMKIKEITIYGYGKWVDQPFDSLTDLQIFYGKNEAGKSTLMVFLLNKVLNYAMNPEKAVAMVVVCGLSQDNMVNLILNELKVKETANLR